MADEYNCARHNIARELLDNPNVTEDQILELLQIGAIHGKYLCSHGVAIHAIFGDVQSARTLCLRGFHRVAEKIGVDFTWDEMFYKLHSSVPESERPPIEDVIAQLQSVPFDMDKDFHLFFTYRYPQLVRAILAQPNPGSKQYGQVLSTLSHYMMLNKTLDPTTDETYKAFVDWLTRYAHLRRDSPAQ